MTTAFLFCVVMCAALAGLTLIAWVGDKLEDEG